MRSVRHTSGEAARWCCVGCGIPAPELWLDCFGSITVRTGLWFWFVSEAKAAKKHQDGCATLSLEVQAKETQRNREVAPDRHCSCKYETEMATTLQQEKVHAEGRGPERHDHRRSDRCVLWPSGTQLTYQQVHGATQEGRTIRNIPGGAQHASKGTRIRSSGSARTIEPREERVRNVPSRTADALSTTADQSPKGSKHHSDRSDTQQHQ